jgi:hypothetical protein
MFLIVRTFIALVLAVSAQAAHAATVGQVEFAQGLASAQQRGQPPRILGQGDALQAGDILNTGPRGFAIINFPDGGKVTLRPNTTFAIDEYNGAAGQESVVLRLLKGGMRTITGTIGRAKPEAVRVQTSTATIVIRGTSFDARLCEADCVVENQQRGAVAGKPVLEDPAVARVLVLQGDASIAAPKQPERRAVRGSALYTGESIRTGKGAHVVLLFRDSTRVTVAAESEFRLENVRLTGNDGGNIAVRLVRGAARTFTGLVARRDPKAFQFSAGTATIGIRGTGFDTRLVQECVAPGNCGDVVYAQLWDGSVALEGNGQALLIPLSRAAVFDALRARIALLDNVPDFFTREIAPRPDRVPVDETLFRAVDPGGTPPGLYVNVRDGHVVLGGLDLGRLEAGYVGPNGVPVRLTIVPNFLRNDPIPTPENFDQRVMRLLEVLGNRSDGLICEM